MANRILRRVAALALCIAATGCSLTDRIQPQLAAPPTLAPVTPGQRDLIYMPPPPQAIPVAVYGFTDQTGQLKPSETQNLSRAVTQGGTSILIKALRDAGNGNWFTVVERERLDNLLRERQIIREMRRSYLGEEETPAEVLPSLLFAGIILEGGIISFDSNVETGGLGARFLSIGGSTQYRTNTVTVYLRAVSVRTGEVLANVVTEKKISSVAIASGVFKFVEFDELLEFEAGVTSNEPVQIAVQSAVEKAVYALILEGARPGATQLWSFADAAAGQQWIARYEEDKRRSMSAIFPKGGGPPGPAAEPSAAVPAPAPAEPARVQ